MCEVPDKKRFFLDIVGLFEQMNSLLGSVSWTRLALNVNICSNLMLHKELLDSTVSFQQEGLVFYSKVFSVFALSEFAHPDCVWRLNCR